DLDCDDDDPDVTGFVSRTCPGGLDAQGSVAGRVVGQREFVALDGTAAPVRYTVAGALCEGWATETSEVARDGQRGLATLQDSTELQVLPEWLEGITGVAPGYAAFVDLRWAGEGWRWPDGAEPDGLPFCSASPALDDFVDLVPTDPTRDDRLAQVAEEARLALVLTADGWCWGAPFEAGFEPQEALALCERPAPNPVDYPTVAP
ncbi:MAG: hypothetical protein AAF211_09170, partial [Myxococcota bacterium]